MKKFKEFLKEFVQKLFFQCKNKTLRGAVLSVDILISFVVIAGLITFLITTIKPTIKTKVEQVQQEIEQLHNEEEKPGQILNDNHNK